MIVTNGFITIVGFNTHHVGDWFCNHCLFLQHLTLCLSLCCSYFDSTCASYQKSHFVRTNLRNAGFAQRIPTSRKKLHVRNPGIARQSTDSYFAQRNPKIARLPGLRGTHILYTLHLHTESIHVYVTTHYDSNALYFADKCRLPYYGDCDFTRECVTTAFGQNCGDCLSGYTQDLTADDPDSAPCVRK